VDVTIGNPLPMVNPVEANSKGYTSSSYPTEGSFSEDVLLLRYQQKYELNGFAVFYMW
jgi:hypothetical protein